MVVDVVVITSAYSLSVLRGARSHHILKSSIEIEERDPLKHYLV